MNDLEPQTMKMAPDDPQRHAEILAALLRRFLNSGDASFFRALSPTLETQRIDLTIRGKLTLTEDEIAAVAIENNRTWHDR